jgi:hypothetical protein
VLVCKDGNKKLYCQRRKQDANVQVFREIGFQALCAKVFFLALLLRFYSHSINISSLWHVISLLKQISSEGFGSKLFSVFLVHSDYGLQNKCSQLWGKWHTRSVCEFCTQSIFRCQLICSLSNTRFSAFRLCYEEVNFDVIIWMCFALLLIGRCCCYCVTLLCFLFSSSVPNMLFIMIKLYVL